MKMRYKIAGMRRKVVSIIFEKSEEEIEYADLLRARARDYAKQKIDLRPRDERSQWFADWDGYHEVMVAEWDSLRARTYFWRRKANASLVELPLENDREGYWERLDGTLWLLTDKGVAYVRSQVRAERQASREPWVRVSPLLVSSLALFISLISILWGR